MNKNVSKKTNTKAKLSTLFMILMLMVSAMGLVACTKESNENEDKAKVTSESQNKTDDKGTDTQVENEESDTEDAKENVKKEPGILKSKTEKMSGTSWVYYYEYDKNGFEIKNVTTDMSTGNIITQKKFQKIIKCCNFVTSTKLYFFLKFGELFLSLSCNKIGQW